MDSPAIFSQPRDPLGALARRREVNVGELGDRMPQRIIHLAQRAIAPVYVSDDPATDARRRGGGECFDAIADDEYDIALQTIERGGELRHSHTRVDCQSIGVARRPWDDGIDLPSFAPDLAQAIAVVAIQMHSGCDELKLERWRVGDGAERGRHQPELSARSGDEADSANPLIWDLRFQI